MDITAVFKASVMAVKLRQKSLPGPVPNKNRILTRTRDEFSKQSKDVRYKITSLKNVLLENRAAYMKFASHLKSSAQMTDEQRDLIDRESEKFFNFYTQHLAQMRADWKKSKTQAQQNDHIDCVLELLTNYLKSVHSLHLEQKKYRMQYELETYRLLKLASDKKKIPIRHGGDRKRLVRSSSESDIEILDETISHRLDDDDDEADNLNRSYGTVIDDRRIRTQKVALDEDIQKSQQIYDDQQTNELSPEDIQMFESENVQLLHELQGLSEEVEQIEKNVVDIARLQDIFTEKISLQKNDIERIANAVVGATENVKDANEQIQQAIQRNAGLRVWALFFLLVMSLTLLFLDWYND